MLYQDITIVMSSGTVFFTIIVAQQDKKIGGIADGSNIITETRKSGI